MNQFKINDLAILNGTHDVKILHFKNKTTATVENLETKQTLEVLISDLSPELTMKEILVKYCGEEIPYVYKNIKFWFYNETVRTTGGKIEYAFILPKTLKAHLEKLAN